MGWGRAQLAEDLLRRGYKVRFRVMGTSMLPAIPPGSLLQIEPIAVEALRPGDVVLTHAWGRMVAHRVQRVRTGSDQPTFILRGDNLAQCDLPVPGSAILGLVRCVAANDN